MRDFLKPCMVSVVPRNRHYHSARLLAKGRASERERVGKATRCPALLGCFGRFDNLFAPSTKWVVWVVVNTRNSFYRDNG